MNIPKIHSHIIWDLTALFLLTALGYWTILLIIRNHKLLGTNSGQEKRKHLGGIIYKLIQYDQGKLKMPERELIELKVELWKLLRKSGNKRIASTILREMDLYLDKGGKQITQRLSNEFGIQWDTLENMDRHVSARKYKISTFDTKPDVIKGEELDLSFIPIVTNNREIQEEHIFGSELEFPLECLDLESFEKNPYEAIYAEINGENQIPPSNSPPKTETSFLNIDFLPFILDNIEEGKEIPLTGLNDLEVEYEVVLDPHFKKQIGDIIKLHLEEENRTAVPGEDHNLLDLGEMKLPAAKFYSDSEFKKVKLLHSIAEMGDMREIPLLNEMLDEEKNESVANLIKEIIFKFLYHYPMDIDEQDNDNSIVDFGEHYVFNHLFSSLDIESQLLLLQEIQQIGDLSDLYFLKTLHNHSNKTIGEKAKMVSRSIEAKFHAFLSGDTQTLSGHMINSKKEISGPQNLSKEPWIHFETTKSGFISTLISEGKNKETDGVSSLNNFGSVPDNVEEHRDNNDGLFHIDFDITSTGNIEQRNGNSDKEDKSASDLEETRFLDQLKALTDKLFKK